MTGRIVNEGTPPPHRCAAERPSEFRVNEGAVWLCEDCGTLWKRVTRACTSFSIEGGEYDYESPQWIEVKDAAGTEWREEEIPPENYLTKAGLLWNWCMTCGRVPKSHRHTRRV